MNTCAICRNRFEAESPAVLFISAYGARRVLCPSCEALLDAATAEVASIEKTEAEAELARLSCGIKDPEVTEELAAILAGEFEEDALTDEEEAELEAVFEDVAKEEAEVGGKEKHSSFWDYLFPVTLGVALLLFAVWLYFFR